MHYLDYAATTPVSRAVADVVYDALTCSFGNPSAQYALGRDASAALSHARSTVAAALGCEAGRLYFTSCGTESDNWAIRAALHQNRRVGRHIITTAVEHHAVSMTCRALMQDGYEVTFLKPDKQGHIGADAVRAALREDTALVSMMLVNNELGTIYPVAEVAAMLRDLKHPALLHTDAVQAFGKIPFTARTLGADFIAISGHKIGAPKGIGALYISPRVKNPCPLLHGGGQEDGLRSGTEATAQIAGFAKAVELHFADFEGKLSHIRELCAYARAQLSTIDGLVFLCDDAAPHILAFSLTGYPSGNVVSDLDAKGICISAGSACHKGKPSDVVAALGLGKKVAAGVLRVSFGADSTRKDVDALFEALREHRQTRFPML